MLLLYRASDVPSEKALKLHCSKTTACINTFNYFEFVSFFCPVCAYAWSIRSHHRPAPADNPFH
jgi:hypothetical protein